MGLVRLARARPRARMFVPRCVSKSRLVCPTTKRRSVGPRHALIVEHEDEQEHDVPEAPQQESKLR